ncbi:MAG: helix-turn-helix transcriptional regulator [Rubrivivax sp.]|nr:helix-turn-helix transcriptional regulator [Rubrivivax sp.]
MSRAGPPAADFAAAAMQRVIVHGARRLGLALPALPPPRPAGAHVPLADKRALLDALAAAQGPLAVLRLGEGAHDLHDDPAAEALAAAQDLPDLVGRWQRLERYVHARHRVQVLSAATGALALRHVALAPHPPPKPDEDLLVLGLLVALAARIGVPGLAARCGPWCWTEGRWCGVGDGADATPEAAPTAHWVLTWQPGPAPPPPPVPADGPALLQRLHDAVGHDLAGRWTLQALARAAGCGPRSLQRRLAQTGTTPAALVAAQRVAAAARLLVHSAEPVAAVGYVCGFADQPHFTRSFKRLSALTPARYRAEFGVAAPDTGAKGRRAPDLSAPAAASRR